MGDKTLKNDKEKEGKTLPPEGLKKVEKIGKDLPTFPAKNEKEEDSSTSPGSEVAEEILSAAEIEEVCGDVIAVPFEMLSIAKVRNFYPLDTKEKRKLAKPLSKLCVKYKIQQYIKEEYLFLFVLGSTIAKRVTVKKDDKHDSGKKGEGKNDISEIVTE